MVWKMRDKTLVEGAETVHPFSASSPNGDVTSSAKIHSNYAFGLQSHDTRLSPIYIIM